MMVTNIDPSGRSRPIQPTQDQSTTKVKQQQQQPVNANADDQPGVTSYNELVQIADDLSAVLAQFRRRNDTEKRAPGATDPFERILEEEAEPKVEQLLFIANAREISPQEFLIQARSMFPDDSDLILVLREIIRRRKIKNEDTSVLEEVMQQIWAEADQKQCKAGMNVGFKAQIFAKKMAVTPWALRDTYRQFLISNEGELSQYEQWVGQYGNVRRQLVAEFIEAALLHDIQSHDPSCSRGEFGALLNHIVNFKRLRSSDDAFINAFLKRKQRVHRRRSGQEDNSPEEDNPEESSKEAEILTYWFDCLRRPFKVKKEIEKNQLAQLMVKTGLSKSELQQKMLKAVNALDADLFFDPEIKDILIETLLSY